jgi:hypothetical protein
MGKVLQVRHPRWNRRKLFAGDGIRLWLKPVGKWDGPINSVRLELELLSPKRIIWSRRLIISQDSVELER